MNPKETVEAYMAAWNEPDVAKRKSMLDKAWADAGTYTDPMSDVSGRDALVELISGFQAQMPGASIVIASGVDQHHNRLRFGWRMLGPDGGTRMEGIDIGVLADDGRIAGITGFFGPLPGA